MNRERVREYRWFLEPLDDTANYAISQLVGEENASFGARTNEGKKVDVWEVNRRIVNFICRSLPHLRSNVNVYVKEGNGQMRLWPFGRH